MSSIHRQKMQKVIVAFDIDGTLRNNEKSYEHQDAGNVIINEEIRTLLVILRKFKNTKIIVWSGGGELYARQVIARMGLQNYVDDYDSKHEATYQPDIAIDDIQECALGKINLIVRQK